MYVQYNKKKGKNGKVYRSVLICEKYREKTNESDNSKSTPKTRVILNITSLPNEIITAIDSVLKKNQGVMINSKTISIKQTFDYGYAYAVLEMMESLRINQTIEKTYRGNCSIIKLMIIGKVLTRGSKLHIFNWINQNPYLADKLGVDLKELSVEGMYSELGLFSGAQNKLERKWNVYHKKRHDNIFLYDITSTYFEGSQNELAAFGYNRDGKKGKKQITIGLITDSSGFPLKIQVFQGNVNDYKTVNEQLGCLRDSFKIKHITLVGDRGMRIRLNLEQLEEEDKQGISYISALADNEIRRLLKEKTIQINQFCKKLVEIQQEDTRYILCLNPLLEQEKRQHRHTLKNKFEEQISNVKQSWQKRKEQHRKNQEKIDKGHKNKKLVTQFSEKQIDEYKYRSYKLLQQFKMRKIFNIEISKEEFEIKYDLTEYQRQKQLDGKYVIESTVKKEKLNTIQVRQMYKQLQNVEHAFRDLKTDKLNIRPVFHRRESQTRGHVFICMFAYAIVKELENVIHPWLKQYNKVEKTQLSFQNITDELKEIKMSEIQMGQGMKKFMIPQLTEKQRQVFSILNLSTQKMLAS